MVDIMPRRMDHSIRVSNRYLQLLTNPKDVYFVPRRTLKYESRRVKGEYAGAVIFKRLPELDKPVKLPVALPIGGTHDYRSYVAMVVDSGEIEPDTLALGKEAIAHEAASLAVYGYLSGERAALPLRAEEQKTDVLTALWRNRH